MADRQMTKPSISEGACCPLPLPHLSQIVLGHGSGGRMTQSLIESTFYPELGNPLLLQRDDSAVVELDDGSRWAFTTDAHIVSPLFFPGGDIGRLAVCGTVNDLAMVGAVPRWLSATFILEEGLLRSDLVRIVQSMKAAAEEAGVWLVAGDTKVAERGKCDRVFITTSGWGQIPAGRNVSGGQAQPGDVVIVSGTMGDHGVAVLAARGDLAFESDLPSDVAPLNGLVEAMFAAGSGIRVLRDPTRGGLTGALHAICQQSQVGIEIQELDVPVAPSVAAACEMLGFDPLYIANEGKLVAIVEPAQAPAILSAMRGHPYGAQARQIGTVTEADPGRLVLRTSIGSRRALEPMAGEMLPRIC
jgi:hydrogenase expression/formation protein HypE